MHSFVTHYTFTSIYNTLKKRWCIIRSMHSIIRELLVSLIRKYSCFTILNLNRHYSYAQCILLYRSCSPGMFITCNTDICMCPQWCF